MRPLNHSGYKLKIVITYLLLHIYYSIGYWLFFMHNTIKKIITNLFHSHMVQGRICE
jgi:hypothetical protein